MRAIPRLVQGWMPKTGTTLFGSIQRSFARRLYKPSALKKEAMEEANLLKQQAFEEMEEDDIENSGLGIEEKRRRLEEKKEAKYRESKASLLDILEKVDEKQCRGCGAHFQFDAPLKEGYIDLRRIKATPISKSQEQLLAKTIRQRKFKEPGDDNEDEGEEEHTIIQEIGDKREGQDTAKMYTVRDYQNDNISLEDVKDLEDLFEGKVIKKDICDRCMMINQGDFEKLKKIEANIDKIPLQHFVTNIFKRIKAGALIILVLDATDLEGSIPQQYIEKLAQGGYDIYVVVNKIDCVPQTISKEKLKGWFNTRVFSLLKELNIVVAA